MYVFIVLLFQLSAALKIFKIKSRYSTISFNE